HKLITSTASCLCLVFFITLASSGAEKIRATPQKFRTFYPANDARIPTNIRNLLANPARTAVRKGARWHLEPDALIQSPVKGLMTSGATGIKRRLSYAEGLPVGDLRVIAVATDVAVWAGGDQGLVRYVGEASEPLNFFALWDRWQYFGGQRYLPSDQVI